MLIFQEVTLKVCKVSSFAVFNRGNKNFLSNRNEGSDDIHWHIFSIKVATLLTKIISNVKYLHNIIFNMATEIISL